MKRGPQRPPGRWGDEGGIGLICYVDRAEVPNLEGYDLIVVTGKTNAKNKAGAPVMLGLPLFTGVGAEQFTEELLEAVKKIMDE